MGLVQELISTILSNAGVSSVISAKYLNTFINENKSAFHELVQHPEHLKDLLQLIVSVQDKSLSGIDIRDAQNLIYEILKIFVNITGSLDKDTRKVMDLWGVFAVISEILHESQYTKSVKLEALAVLANAACVDKYRFVISNMRIIEEFEQFYQDITLDDEHAQEICLWFLMCVICEKDTETDKFQHLLTFLSNVSLTAKNQHIVLNLCKIFSHLSKKDVLLLTTFFPTIKTFLKSYYKDKNALRIIRYCFDMIYDLGYHGDKTHNLMMVENGLLQLLLKMLEEEQQEFYSTMLKMDIIVLLGNTDRELGNNLIMNYNGGRFIRLIISMFWEHVDTHQFVLEIGILLRFCFQTPECVSDLISYGGFDIVLKMMTLIFSDEEFQEFQTTALPVLFMECLDHDRERMLLKLKSFFFFHDTHSSDVKATKNDWKRLLKLLSLDVRLNQDEIFTLIRNDY